MAGSQGVEATVLAYDCPHDSEEIVYIGSGRFIIVFDRVYLPAEDTWQTLDCLCKTLVGEIKFKHLYLIEVGSGSGAVFASAVLNHNCGGESFLGYVVAIDIHPCAAANSLLNAKLLGIQYLVDVVQCSYTSCLRPLSRVLVVFNTPYLPPEEAEDIDQRIALSGGMNHAVQLLNNVVGWRDFCLVLTYSSLSGDIGSFEKNVAAEGYQEACRLISHYFFEDIISVAVCRLEGQKDLQ